MKKLTSSIMAVIKVLARVEAANQLAGGPLPPEAFYNTLIRCARSRAPAVPSDGTRSRTLSPLSPAAAAHLLSC